MLLRDNTDCKVEMKVVEGSMSLRYTGRDAIGRQ